jgi:hypothetical protein
MSFVVFFCSTAHSAFAASISRSCIRHTNAGGGVPRLFRSDQFKKKTKPEIIATLASTANNIFFEEVMCDDA